MNVETIRRQPQPWGKIRVEVGAMVTAVRVTRPPLLARTGFEYDFFIETYPRFALAILGRLLPLGQCAYGLCARLMPGVWAFCHMTARPTAACPVNGPRAGSYAAATAAPPSALANGRKVSAIRKAPSPSPHDAT